MRICVLGGLGFIGSHLVDDLINKGHKVSVIDDLSTGNIEFKNEKAIYHYGKVQEYGKSSQIFNDFRPEYVFHLAALPRVPRSLEDPIGTHDANVNATLVALELSRKYKVKRFIYSASSSAFGDQKEMPCIETMMPNPLSPYGLQKYIGELYCKQYSRHFGLDTVSLRYFNVFGSRAPTEGTYCLVMNIFIRQKKEGKKLTIFGTGEQTRDFTFVSDVVKANVLAMESKENLNGEIINIGSGKETSVNRIAELIGGEKEYIVPNPREKFEEARKVAENSKAELLLGWKPTVFIEEGIKKLLNEKN